MPRSPLHTETTLPDASEEALHYAVISYYESKQSNTAQVAAANVRPCPARVRVRNCVVLNAEESQRKVQQPHRATKGIIITQYVRAHDLNVSMYIYTM